MAGGLTNSCITGSPRVPTGFFLFPNGPPQPNYQSLLDWDRREKSPREELQEDGIIRNHMPLILRRRLLGFPDENEFFYHEADNGGILIHVIGFEGEEVMVKVLWMEKLEGASDCLSNLQQPSQILTPDVPTKFRTRFLPNKNTIGPSVKWACKVTPGSEEGIVRAALERIEGKPKDVAIYPTFAPSDEASERAIRKWMYDFVARPGQIVPDEAPGEMCVFMREETCDVQMIREAYGERKDILYVDNIPQPDTIVFVCHSYRDYRGH